MLGRWVIGWYLRTSNPGSAYVAMGGVVLMLVWMYYAALIVFVGALITAVVDERRRRGLDARKPRREDAEARPAA